MFMVMCNTPDMVVVQDPLQYIDLEPGAITAHLVAQADSAVCHQCTRRNGHVVCAAWLMGLLLVVVCGLPVLIIFSSPIVL